MNSAKYIEQATRTESPNFNMIDVRILHSAIGICTEAGELLDNVKKASFYNRPLGIWNLQEELGDIFWYMALLCSALGCTFEEIMDKNIKKLKERYPEQFTEINERNRNYEAEQNAAEKGKE